MIQSLKLNKPTSTSAKSKMNVLIDSLVEDPYGTLLIINSDLFLNEINNISDSNLVDRGGAPIRVGSLEYTSVMLLPNLCSGSNFVLSKTKCTEIGMRESMGNLELLIQIEKSVLELENKSKTRRISPPKPQHLCGTRTKEAPSSLPPAAPQPIYAWICLPVESPVGQLDENGSENYFQRNSYHSTRKSNDSWSISETMITESNKLRYNSPQIVLPVDHKINSNIETFRSRVRRAETELEMIAPKPKPQKINENIHDPYGYGPTGIQSNK
ncbi:hypothetical protein PPACK8108_LOCUS21697 [Phakopsora pachyrhizi]|uniref:Uncharacterized protein n=1 Tax=Phakopsora pachyrhizi TaxID=170000 RepID=A0AAV0BLZ0_PHAPC|nr:hypothetical protein PPACK8108_LOCUS21697 [Phakopsora pachyrhizi]